MRLDHVAQHLNQMFQSDDLAIEIRKNFLIPFIEHFDDYIKTHYS